jgi:hypothetical protein
MVNTNFAVSPLFSVVLVLVHHVWPVAMIDFTQHDLLDKPKLLLCQVGRSRDVQDTNVWSTSNFPRNLKRHHTTLPVISRKESKLVVASFTARRPRTPFLMDASKNLIRGYQSDERFKISLCRFPNLVVSKSH